jgi:hypothetical protein
MNSLPGKLGLTAAADDIPNIWLAWQINQRAHLKAIPLFRDGLA